MIPKYSAKAELLAQNQTTRAAKAARARLGMEDSDDEFEDAVDSQGLFKNVWKKVKKPAGKLAMGAAKQYLVPLAKETAKKGAMGAVAWGTTKVLGGGRGGALRPAGSGMRGRPRVTGRALFAA